MVLFDQFYSFPYSKGSYTNSPGYGTNLPLSRIGHQQKSRIKSTFEIFCSLIGIEPIFVECDSHCGLRSIFAHIYTLTKKKKEKGWQRKGGEREKHVPAKPMKLQNTPKSVAILCFTEIHKQVMKIELVFKGSQKFTADNNIDKCTIFVLNNSSEKKGSNVRGKLCRKHVLNSDWQLQDLWKLYHMNVWLPYRWKILLILVALTCLNCHSKKIHLEFCFQTFFCQMGLSLYCWTQKFTRIFWASLVGRKIVSPVICLRLSKPNLKWYIYKTRQMHTCNYRESESTIKKSEANSTISPSFQ